MTTHLSKYKTKKEKKNSRLYFSTFFITFTYLYILRIFYSLNNGLVFDFIQFSRCGIKILHCQNKTEKFKLYAALDQWNYKTAK